MPKASRVFRGGLVRAFGAALVLALSAAPLAAQAVEYTYPLKVSASGRYLTDQADVPWRIQADAAWLMSTNATPAQVDTYLATRRSQGFNSFYLMAMVHPGGYWAAPHAPDNASGDPPFATPGLFSTAGASVASERYWAWIDSIVDKAAAQGMVVMLAYTYLGYAGGSQGWYQDVLAQPSRQDCADWGYWLGSRYREKSNIVWFALGDYTPPPGSEGEARTLAIAQGIKAAGATQLFMAEPSGGSAVPTLDAPAFASILDMNSFYGYGPTGRGETYVDADRAWRVLPPKPAWVQEGGYEFENNTGGFTGASYETRRTRLWAVLGGGTAGDGFGSYDAWQWLNFPAGLSTPGAAYSTHSFGLFASLPWWDLRPSGIALGYAGKELIVAGKGTRGQTDYVTSALTSDGQWLLAYIPTTGGTSARTLTADMSALSGSARARWFNPATGAYTDIGSGYDNAGTRSFTSPGDNGTGTNDWVLVIDAAPAPPAFDLTVSLAGAGQGVVVSVPPAIDCGAVCVGRFPTGTPVVLTALPAAGSLFTGWGGACTGLVCALTIGADTSVTATFTTIVGSSTLTVAKAGTGAGRITSSPAGLDCGSVCSASYPVGTAVTITATPDPGSTFAGWSDGGAATHVVTVGGQGATYTATFSAIVLPPEAGLVAAYAFEEGAGTTAVDATGHGLDGTIEGASWTSAGRFGRGLSFDGGSSAVELGNPAALRLTGSMTWAAWIYATADPWDDGQIVAKSASSGWQFKTSPDTGPHTFAVAVSPDAGSLTQRYSTTVRALGRWYHVAGVYDAGAQTLDIYVDGVRSNGELRGAVPASQYDSPEPVRIGRRSGGFYFAGTIDEVRIYDRALTAAEVVLAMNTPLAPPSDVEPPAAPTGLTAAPAATAVELAWTPSTDDVGVAGYQVERCRGTVCRTFARVGTTGGAAYQDTGLLAHTTYRYRVRATDGAGHVSAWSSIVRVRTVDSQPPTAPEGLTVSAVSATRVALTWAASTDDVAVARYQVLRCRPAACERLWPRGTTVTTTFRDVDVAVGTTYQYRVRARDFAGNWSAYSPATHATTPRRRMVE
jgi:chitodextrinase